MRQYLFSVICACLICGILLSLVKGAASQAIVKLLCSALLAVSILAPLSKVDFSREFALLLPDKMDGDRMARAGEDMARKSLAGIIKENAEAYILDKAAELQGELTVDITVTNEDLPVPAAAMFSGRVSPLEKAWLETIMERDLGIPKENLRWSG